MQNLPLKHWKNMNLKWERLSELTNLVYKRFVPRRLSLVMLLKCQVSYNHCPWPHQRKGVNRFWLPWQLNFVHWHLTFVGSQCETFFMSSFGHLEFWGSLQTFGEFVHPCHRIFVNCGNFSVKWYSVNWTSRVHFYILSFFSLNYDKQCNYRAFSMTLRLDGKINSDHHDHSVLCLTTGSKPPPKRFLHIVRSRASSFKWEYSLLSWELYQQ